MKNIIVVVFLTFLNLNVNAQELVIKNDSEIYTIVDQKAVPKDGIKAFYQKFVKDFNTNVVTEDVSLIKFRLKFVVEKNGNLNDIIVVSENQSEDIQIEAVRVLKLSEWYPAQQNGVAVRSVYVLPIEFRKN